MTATQGPDVSDEDLRTIREFLSDFIEIREDFILLEINENNVVSQKENFEIELFEIVENATDKASNEYERLKPLKFDGPRMNNDTDFVDYYLNLDVDMEIDERMLCKYKEVDDTKGLFFQGVYECEPEQDRQSADQYRTIITDIGEVCD